MLFCWLSSLGSSFILISWSIPQCFHLLLQKLCWPLEHWGSCCWANCRAFNVLTVDPCGSKRGLCWLLRTSSFWFYWKGCPCPCPCGWLYPQPPALLFLFIWWNGRGNNSYGKPNHLWQGELCWKYHMEDLTPSGNTSDVAWYLGTDNVSLLWRNS